MRCRLCQGKIKKFLDLGRTPLPEEFRLKQNLHQPIEYYPLNLSSCTSCHHVQLGDQVPADLIYKKNYFYDYSLTEKGQIHWYKLSKRISKEYKLSKNDLVVDIGSNTGTLLGYFKLLGTKILGIDPAKKLADMAVKRGIPTINSYFNPKIAKKIVKNYGPAKVISCTNTFDHVNNLDEFMQAIAILLRPDGLFLIEVPYFLTMMQSLNHIVYHQQIDYLMIKSLIPFLGKHGFEITDLRKIPFHGGSIRIFIHSKGTKRIQNTVYQAVLAEDLFKIDHLRLPQFATKVFKQRDNLKKLLIDLKQQHKKIAAVGASAKGIALLNYCHIGPQTVEFITEKSPLKINRFTASGIPIKSDDWFIKQKVDYALILAWNFKEEIIKNLKQFKKLGGKFIIPVPKVTII